MQLPPPAQAASEQYRNISCGKFPAADPREPSFGGQKSSCQHADNLQNMPDGSPNCQQGVDRVGNASHVPADSNRHDYAHGAAPNHGAVAGGDVHYQEQAAPVPPLEIQPRAQPSTHLNDNGAREPHNLADMYRDAPAQASADQHAGGAPACHVEGQMGQLPVQGVSAPRVAEEQHLADLKVPEQEASAEGRTDNDGERKRRLWEGESSFTCTTDMAILHVRRGSSLLKGRALYSTNENFDLKAVPQLIWP